MEKLRRSARVRTGEGGAESGPALCAGLALVSCGRSAALGSEATVPRDGCVIARACGGVGGRLPRGQTGTLQSSPAEPEQGAAARSGVGRGCGTGPTAGSGRPLPLFEQSGFDGEARPLKHLQCQPEAAESRSFFTEPPCCQLSTSPLASEQPQSLASTGHAPLTLNLKQKKLCTCFFSQGRSGCPWSSLCRPGWS